VKLFLWERLADVSSNWHTGGGLVVVAKDLDAAIALARQDEYIKVTQEDKPDFECNTDATEEKVFVFPDAGCC